MALPFQMANPALQNYQGPTSASFTPTSAPISVPGTPAKSYEGAYSNYVNLNKQLYDNINSGYARMLTDMRGAQAGLQAGYTGLESRVMQRLAGKNRANIRDIGNKYTALSGQMSQQMIDRGLGNTTVQQSIQRGLASDQAAETTRSREGYSKLMADYQTRIGGNALEARQQGISMMSGIQGRTLDWMNSITAPPPDPGLYAQLAAMEREGRMPAGGFPGMPGPSRGNAPTGGYGPRGSAFYEAGGGYDAGPMSGASLNMGGGPFQPHVPDPAWAMPSYADPNWISASRDQYGYTAFGYGGTPQTEAYGYGGVPEVYADPNVLPEQSYSY